MGVFRFKQFSVCDDGAAMKVGTDAVLLGAWTDISHAGRILDIGTGSGVIALILGQRTSPECVIDAIERVTADAEQARNNVASSPWPDKIHIHHASLQEYFPAARYDLLVCNPPFFSDSQLPSRAEKVQARHTIALTVEDLIAGAARLLTASGRLSLILPPAEAAVFLKKASIFFPRRLTRFFSRSGKPQERTLLELSMQPGAPIVNDLVLYAEGSSWTTEYHELVREFYLSA